MMSFQITLSLIVYFLGKEKKYLVFRRILYKLLFQGA